MIIAIIAAAAAVTIAITITIASAVRVTVAARAFEARRASRALLPRLYDEEDGEEKTLVLRTPNWTPKTLLQDGQLPSWKLPPVEVIKF